MQGRVLKRGDERGGVGGLTKLYQIPLESLDPMLHLVVMSPLSLVSLWQFFSLLICHAFDTFVRYWSSILCSVLKVGLSDVFLWSHWGYGFYFSFFRNTTEMMCPFEHTSRVHDISMSYYLVVLNLFMWLGGMCQF